MSTYGSRSHGTAGGKGVVSTCTYSEIQPWSGWVGMIVWNMSSKEEKLPAKSAFECIEVANIFPKSLALKPIEEVKPKAEVVYSQGGHFSGYTEAQKPTIWLILGVLVPTAILNQINLSGCDE